MTINQQKPDLYLSMPHACSYLPQRTSTIVFVDPHYMLDNNLYGSFVRQGFRRSGDLVYRPYCQGCAACIPVRIPAERFTPTRGQKRVWARNQDIQVHTTNQNFSEEHFSLYRRYQAMRHPGSSMDDADPERYIKSLASTQADTVFYEMRGPGRNPAENGRESLLAVAVADILPDGLSAVYTFFDPDIPGRGLGVFAILWQLKEIRRLGLEFLYLGYWIRECPKMAYKTDYRPLEALQHGHWGTLPRE